MDRTEVVKGAGLVEGDEFRLVLLDGAGVKLARSLRCRRVRQRVVIGPSDDSANCDRQSRGLEREALDHDYSGTLLRGC